MKRDALLAATILAFLVAIPWLVLRITLWLDRRRDAEREAYYQRPIPRRTETFAEKRARKRRQRENLLQFRTRKQA